MKCGSGGPATKRNCLRDLKSLRFIEIYRFLKIYNYEHEDLSRFLESYERFMEIFRFMKIFRDLYVSAVGERFLGVEHPQTRNKEGATDLRMPL